MLKCNKILIRHFDNYQESSYFLKNLLQSLSLIKHNIFFFFSTKILS